jgi:hypothetical protein
MTLGQTQLSKWKKRSGLPSAPWASDEWKDTLRVRGVSSQGGWVAVSEMGTPARQSQFAPEQMLRSKSASSVLP